ncbi:hypothetical protein BgiBS90_009729 [Biomphalaria glabrata]|nr:hypothetical protein BgiBS90_009729 [Biomphalaria glabrata]
MISVTQSLSGQNASERHDGLSHLFTCMTEPSEPASSNFRAHQKLASQQTCFNLSAFKVEVQAFLRRLWTFGAVQARQFTGKAVYRRGSLQARQFTGKAVYAFKLPN